jgi:dTDP-4-dehydrorhamnose 3,5-epimerase
MFEVIEAGLPGVRLLRPIVRRDSRGLFVKTMHRDFFAGHGMATDFAEQYYSVSERNVVRGLHFQIPPHDHYKLVTCIEGEIRDVVVDLRRDSPTYRQHAAIEMSGERGDCVYIPSGLAHGFAVYSARALVLYNVSSVYAPAHDTGIRWDTAGIAWGVEAPLISDRDAGLPPFPGLVTPF